MQFVKRDRISSRGRRFGSGPNPPLPTNVEEALGDVSNFSNLTTMTIKPVKHRGFGTHRLRKERFVSTVAILGVLLLFGLGAGLGHAELETRTLAFSLLLAVFSGLLGFMAGRGKSENNARPGHARRTT